MITETETLAAVCARFAERPYVTVDTEFMRERTYYAQLCLVQLAVPGEGSAAVAKGARDAAPDAGSEAAPDAGSDAKSDAGPEDGANGAGEAVLVDPLADGIDLAPLYALLSDPRVVKVFHAARQDVEIFYHRGGVIPAPMFDSQVAAMVLGYGEQVGYETLVRKIARVELDKSSRFTDWSRRPLSEHQLRYALGDVTHLRTIYETLAERLASTGREEWVREEIASLTDPATYDVDPGEMWRRVKARTGNGETLAVVRELARWREETAQTRDVPRARLMKDDALVEIAAAKPRDVEGLSKMRLLQREGRRPELAEAILAAVARGVACPPTDRPQLPPPPRRKEGSAAVADLLRVFLKARADSLGIAPKLLASSSDLDALAGDEAPDVPALHGWRLQVFGADALRLKTGEVGLKAGRRGVEMIETPG
ncbi:MAG: ribonuclease D [Pseudomonadota bacterium]